MKDVCPLKLDLWNAKKKIGAKV